MNKVFRFMFIVFLVSQGRDRGCIIQLSGDFSTQQPQLGLAGLHSTQFCFQGNLDLLSVPIYTIRNVILYGKLHAREEGLIPE